jgi:hypothetical protein
MYILSPNEIEVAICEYFYDLMSHKKMLNFCGTRHFALSGWANERFYLKSYLF